MNVSMGSIRKYRGGTRVEWRVKRVRDRRYRGAVDSGCNNLFSRATRATQGARLIPREEAFASSFQYLRSR